MIPAGLRRMLTFRNRRTKASAQTGMMTTHRKAPPPRRARLPRRALLLTMRRTHCSCWQGASDLHVSPQSGNGPAPSPDSVIRPSSNIHELDNSLIEVEKFFRSGQFNLDAGPELDPIDPGPRHGRRGRVSFLIVCYVAFGACSGRYPSYLIVRLPELPGPRTLTSFVSQLPSKLALPDWGLDPMLYSSSFTRSRSAFLFTSIG